MIFRFHPAVRFHVEMLRTDIEMRFWVNGPNGEPFCNEIKPTTKWLGEVTPVVSIPFDHVAIPCRPLVTERIELFLLAHTIVDSRPIRLITKRMHENYKM